MISNEFPELHHQDIFLSLSCLGVKYVSFWGPFLKLNRLLVRYEGELRTDDLLYLAEQCI